MSYPIPEEIEQNLTVTGQPRVDALCYVIRALFATRSIGWIASTDRAAWMHRPSATYLSLVVDRSNTSKDIHVVIQRHDRLLSGWLRHTPDLQEYLEIEQSETGWEHVLVDPGWEPMGVLAERQRVVCYRPTVAQRRLAAISPAAVAASSDREGTLRLALPILLRLRKRAGLTELWRHIRFTRGAMDITFARSRDGIYVAAGHPRARMRGYLDPVNVGRHALGQFHIMHWERGWAVPLFDDGAWDYQP